MNLMNISIATLTAVVVVIIAFVSGAYMGSHFYCPRAESMKSLVPKNRKRSVRKAAENGSGNSIYSARKGSDNLGEPDMSVLEADRQRQFEEDLKAFEACMNYSAERAYDIRGDYFSD